MVRLIFLLGLLGCAGNVFADSTVTAPSMFFGIEVVDQDTSRGVPMVELLTTSGIPLYTDSNGLVAFYEPGLMNQKVWFAISAHGYEFAPDGFGLRGVSLMTKPGAIERLKIKRLNIAERLYRITGEGIYRDTVLLGRKAPISQPLLNAGVTGQDGILTAIYRDRLFWFYGDTSRLSYGLGNFSMTGATTALPARLDPATGFDLIYFTNQDGFVKKMAPIKGEGVVWLSGLVVLPEGGHESMLAWFQRRRGLGAVLENGFVIYNDAKDVFETLKDEPIDPPLFPTGYPTTAPGEDSQPYLYFTVPYPALRVKASKQSYLDLSAYEGFTCLRPGARYSGQDKTELDRDGAGKLVWGWKRGTPALDAKQQEELIQAGRMKRDESPFRLSDAGTGKPVLLNSCSCFWNQYRKRFVMIASEVLGATVLGEVWYSESDRPEGPWTRGTKIITHANKKDDAHDFYNPTQHPFFDQQGGRVIYLEGSYVNTFSGNPTQTPYYEYNQIMYRLDLADPRLKPAR
ncbi:MAG TPA: hypothetical protein VFE51_25105 [Verrucomicrobiae bacterium]|nr:hypothetical protein [Verrucomicrobiae bacterium]